MKRQPLTSFLRRFVIGLLTILLPAFAFEGRAQIVNIDFSIPTQRTLTNLNELQELAERGEMSLTLTNLTTQIQVVQLEVVMFSNTTGFRIQTDPNSPNPPTTGLRPGANLFNTQQILDLFDENSFVLGDGTPLTDYLATNLTGAIESGLYQLCIRIRPETLNQQLINSLSNNACANVTFQQYTTPLINTINGVSCGAITPELLDANAPFLIAFTPPAFSLNNVTLTNFNYKIRIFELLDTDGRDPNQVFQALQDRNEPGVWVVNKELMNIPNQPLIVEQLQPQDFVSKLELGHKYVVSVQAISTTGDPLPNDGSSPVCFFQYNIDDGSAPEPIVVLDDDLPEACKDGNCGTLTENLTGGIAHNAFQKGEVFRIGCFKVLVDDPVAKKGFVTIPFFSAKFAVDFSGVTVQKFDTKLIATAGKVTGLKDNKFPSGIISDLYESFKEADRTVSNVTNALPAPVTAILQGKIDTLNQVSDNINTAFQTILTTQRLIEQVGNSDFETGLPAGIENDVNGRPLRIGIFGMTFETTKASMHVIVQTPPIPGVLQPLYFGGSNICFSPNDASIKDATFYLGGDLNFPIADHKLILKGTQRDGAAERGTYLKLNDWDFDEINLVGEMELDDKVFVPKPPATGKVKIAFAGNATDNFDDLLLSSTVETPVALAGFKSFGFVLKDLSLDLSTTKNPTGWTMDRELSQNMYETGFINTWTGIYVKEAVIVLPSDFNLGNVARSPSLKVDNLLIGFDGSGVSFKASLGDLMTLNDGGSLGGLGFSIDSLNMKMVSNNIDAFYLKGKLRFGLFDAGTHEGAFPYKIDILDLINKAGNSGNGSSDNGELALACDMTLNEDIDLTISKLHTTFTLGSNSRVEYNSRGLDGVADRKLRFKLNGAISIEADDVNLPGMHFENFIFEGHDLKLDQFTVGFASPQKTAGGTNEEGTKAGGFPISIEGFRPILGAGTNGGLVKFGFGFDIILNLKEGAGFGLTTAIDITTELDRDFKPTLDIDVAFKKISIEADVSVSHISGFLEFVKETGNKGFRGCLTVEMKVPAPIRGQLQGMFGTKIDQQGQPYRYFYIEGMISGLQGILIPSTPIAIDGFAGGFWYNMKKLPNAPSFAARLNTATANGDCIPPMLVPSKDTIGIALGVMFKEAASQGFSFNGILTFEAELTTDLAPLTFTVGGAARFVKMPGPAPEGSMSQLNEPIKMAADISLTYDFTENILYGQMNAYLKVGEVIKGGVDQNTGHIGTMAMYFGGGDWYVYLGNPWRNEGRKGEMASMGRYATIVIDIPKVGSIEGGTYFCMGTYGIRQVTEPAPIGIPTTILSFINENRPDFDPRASSGTGIAFGAYLKGDFETGAGPFVASVDFGFGFDLALVRYLTPQCGRGQNDFGINNYYATGEIYGFAKGSIDVIYDGDSYNIATANLSAVAVFGGPNPTWIKGKIIIDKETTVTLIQVAAGAATGGVYTVVDGAAEAADGIWNSITGTDEEPKGITERIVDAVAPNGIRIDFAIGEDCSGPINASSSFDDRQNSQSIISYILPQANSGETTPKLEPYQSISVQFSRPINEIWEIIKPDGTLLKRRWYIKTVEIKRGEGGTVLPHDFVDISTTEYKYWIKYASNAQPLGSGATVRFKIVLGLKEKAGNGSWIDKLTYTTGTGNRTTDDVKTQTFEIAPINYELTASDVKFSYPLVGQNYFLQNHGAKFIILNKFLPEFEKVKREDLITKIYSGNDLIGESTFTYSKINYAESAFEYSTPTLPNESNIKVEFYVRKVVATVAVASANSTDQKSSSTTNRQSDIVSFPQAGNTTQIPTELVKVYTLTFKTSKFNSFPEKMASTRSTPFFHPSPDSYIMNKRFMFDEGWDGFEVGRVSPGNSIYNNLVENSNGSRTHLGHFVSSASVTMNTPWHTAMSAVVEQEYNNGDAYSNSFWFGTQRIGTDLVEGHDIDLTFEQHESIRSEMRYPERLTPPTAGNYEFTLEYQYPVLDRGVVKHFTQNAQPATSATQIGGNFTSIQVFTIAQSSTIYKTTVAYEGMQATLANQQTTIKNGIQKVQQAHTNEIKIRGR